MNTSARAEKQTLWTGISPSITACPLYRPRTSQAERNRHDRDLHPSGVGLEARRCSGPQTGRRWRHGPTLVCALMVLGEEARMPADWRLGEWGIS
jgi:hypothetical protein